MIQDKEESGVRDTQSSSQFYGGWEWKSQKAGDAATLDNRPAIIRKLKAAIIIKIITLGSPWNGVIHSYFVSIALNNER